MSLEFFMSDASELKAFARLEGAVGGVSALKLCAVLGPQTLYVPTEIGPDHFIARLIGQRDAIFLADECGGQDVWIPALEMRAYRRLGELRRLMRRGTALPACADRLGVTQRHTRRLVHKILMLEGLDADRLIPPERKDSQC